MHKSKEKNKACFVSAVIVSAGSSSRMNGIDKQSYPLGDIPVVVRTLTCFCGCDDITEIVLVCRQEEIPDYYAIIQDYNLHKVKKVVAGGQNRQQSVFNGIENCSAESEYFAIHDGARPLVTAGLIADCVNDAKFYRAAAVGVPVKDTIKVRSRDGFIESTPERSTLFAIQTPQIFEAGLYRDSMQKAQKENKIYTDDCQLVENNGGRVFISCGDYSNIKITTPEDLAVARALIDFYEEDEI